MLSAALISTHLAAQTAPPRELTLIAGRGELVQFGADVTRVAVSEPKVADAVVVSPREVMINAKGAGKATIVVWETGSVPARYQINVISDEEAFDNLTKRIQDSLPEANISVSGNTETLVLSGSVKDFDQLQRAEALASTYSKKVVNLLRAPDPPEPRQILLQVKFATVDRAALHEVGFNYFSRNDKMLGVASTQQFQGPRFSQLQFQDQSFANASVNFADLLNIFVFRPDLNIGTTIKALQSRNLLQMLAEPNLITVEGKEASFLAGGRFPYPTIQATTTGGAVAPVITVRFQPFGIELGFTPTITPQGSIRLKVAPEVSALDYSNAVTLQGFLIPALSTRRADTEVILKDGESFAIAGLIDNRVVQTINKIPWLGDIPYLGYLFKSRSTKKSTDELLVVVTPHFVRPLSPGEKVPMLDLPEDFLPPVTRDKEAGSNVEKQMKADEKARKEQEKGQREDQKTQTAPPPAQGQAEFVGPRGYQLPKP
jgi:pilus assembly protein CpaC